MKSIVLYCFVLNVNLFYHFNLNVFYSIGRKLWVFSNQFLRLSCFKTFQSVSIYRYFYLLLLKTDTLIKALTHSFSHLLFIHLSTHSPIFHSFIYLSFINSLFRHSFFHTSGILTVPAMDACGFNPCFEKACKVDLTARCVTDAHCKPTFITTTERILDECVGKQII